MNLRLPPGLDERTVEHFMGRDEATGAKAPDRELSALSDCIRAAREEAAALVALDAAMLADRTRTPESAAMTVADAAKKSAGRIAGRLDAVRQKALDAIERTEALTGAPPPPITPLDIAREAETRAALKAMSDAERTDVIGNAFATRRMSVIAAVLHADAFLSGIGEARLAALRERYRKEHHEADYQRIKQLKASVEAFDRAGRLFVGLVRQAQEAPLAVSASANRSASEAALAAHGARS